MNPTQEPRRLYLAGLLFLLSGAIAAKEVGDGQYPKIRTTAAGTVVIHTPQITKWTKFRELEGWLALEVSRAGAEQPLVGSVGFSALSDVDLQHRTVDLTEIRVTQVVFPEATDPQRLDDLVRSMVTSEARTVPLDVILHGLPKELMSDTRVKLRLEPPAIHMVTDPTVLLLLDGEPILEDIEGTSLAQVANTSAHLFFDHDGKRWYALNEQIWQTSDRLDGAWHLTTSLPDGFERLPESSDWQAVREQVPPRTPEEAPPQVIVSTTSAASLSAT